MSPRPTNANTDNTNIDPNHFDSANSVSSSEHDNALLEEDLDSSDLEGDDIDDAELEDDGDLLDDDELEDDSADQSEAQGSTREVNAEHVVTVEQAGLRIDKLAAQIFTDFSRAQLQSWINDGKLLVDGNAQKSKYRVKVGQTFTLAATLEQHSEDLPEDIDLEIVYEDDDVIVVNKPVGMVVHPGAGNWSGTLVNALLFHFPEQQHLPRAGLVHRIDKDTSGLLIVAKTKTAQLNLTDQLKDKTVYRHYQCIVAGGEENLKRFRHINEPIGRHHSMRTKMMVTDKGRDAVTHLIKITPLNESYSLVDVQLETGRTHQIRVHLSHIGHPLVGDRVYGGRRQLRAGITEKQRRAVMNFPRQALHAYTLGFVHPVTEENVEVSTPMPADMMKLMEQLSDFEE